MRENSALISDSFRNRSEGGDGMILNPLDNVRVSLDGQKYAIKEIKVYKSLVQVVVRAKKACLTALVTIQFLKRKDLKCKN